MSAQEKMLRLFKSANPSCIYTFKDGASAYFVGGRFTTDDPAKIEELDEEIAKGHPVFFIDAKEKEVSSVRQDPMEALRAKFIKEYLAEQAGKVGTDHGGAVNPALAGMMTSASLEEGSEVTSSSQSGTGASVNTATLLAGISAAKK